MEHLGFFLKKVPAHLSFIRNIIKYSNIRIQEVQYGVKRQTDLS